MKLWIFLGGYRKTGLFLGVISKHSRVFMTPKELWEAYSNHTVRPSVRPSVPLSCHVHISYII